MNVSIALSIDSLINDLLAQSALRFHLGSPRPNLLIRDNSQALARLVMSKMGEIASDINASMASSDADIVVFELSLQTGASASGLRSLIESAIVSATAAEIYVGCDPAAAAYHAGRHQNMRQAMRAMITGTATIVPCRY